MAQQWKPRQKTGGEQQGILRRRRAEEALKSVDIHTKATHECSKSENGADKIDVRGGTRFHSQLVKALNSGDVRWRKISNLGLWDQSRFSGLVARVSDKLDAGKLEQGTRGGYAREDVKSIEAIPGCLVSCRKI